MSIDKKISYVEQDGVKNYIKNSESVTVPKKFKARKDATPTKLAYITKDEARMLKKMKKGTPHKGPKGIPSYDDYDADTGTFTSGTAMSAMETGSTDARDRAEVQASSYGAPSGAGPGVKTKKEQEIRNAFIAAGGGQRVNPSFFDSRDTVSAAELAAAKAFNPAAFKANRRGGIMDFFTGGGFLGNLLRGIGQKFGLGKKFDEPTYDLSKFNELGLLTDRVNPQFPTDLGNEGLLSLLKNEKEGTDRPLRTSTFFDDTTIDRVGSSNVNTTDKFIVPFEGARTIIRNPNYIEPGGTVLTDEFPSTPPPVRDDNIPLDLNFTLPIDQFVDAYTIPTEGKFGVSLSDYTKLRNEGFNDRQIQELQSNPRIDIKEVIRDIEGPIGIV